MEPNGIIECHTDSGFTKVQENGYGVRGANFFRKGMMHQPVATGSKSSNFGEVPCVHLLDSQCRGHKHVTRDSFSSETRAAVVACDELMVLSLTLHELEHGVVSPEAGRYMIDNGNCKIQTILTMDSMSLWSAIAAVIVKVPAEKNLANLNLWAIYASSLKTSWLFRQQFMFEILQMYC